MVSRRAFMAGVLSGACISPIAYSQQARKVPRIGVLWHAANIEEETPYFQSLIEGFRVLGYVEGRNIAFEHRFPNEVPELFARMATELVSSKPDVLVGAGAAASYLKKATATIPIIFVYVPDPVGADLVESVRRPGGNATGMTNFGVLLSAKRLEIFKETVPSVTRVGLLVNPNVKISSLYIQESMQAGLKLGIAIQAFEARALSDFEPAFDAMVKARMQGVVVNAESLFFQGKHVIAKLALARNLPTCVYVRELLEAGGLVSYGVDQRAIARRVAVYVERVLKGEKPSEMPVEQPTRFELIVNTKTAKALGVKIPQMILGRADDVVH